MRSDRVEVLAPLLDDDGGILQAVEDFAVEAFVAQLAIEGLAVAVIPWAAWRNVKRLCAGLSEPVAHDLGRHLRAVVRPDVLRNAFGNHHVGHGVDDAEAVDATGNPDRRHSRGNSSISVMSWSLRPSWVCVSTKS